MKLNMPTIDADDAFAEAISIFGQFICSQCGTDKITMRSTRAAFCCNRCYNVQFSIWRKGSPLYHSRIQPEQFFVAVALYEQGAVDKQVAFALRVNHHTAARLRLTITALSDANRAACRDALARMIAAAQRRAA